MTDTRLPEITDILEGRPSRFAFQVLRALLDTWPDAAGRDNVIRRAGSALVRSGWPARTRYLSVWSNAEMSANLCRPSSILVRTLRWVPDEDTRTHQVVDDLASSPVAQRLRSLVLDHPSDEVLHQLALRACFPNLVALTVNLGWDNERRSVIPYLISGLPSGLRYLKVTGSELLDDGKSDEVPEVVDAIASSSVVRHLRSISLPNMHEVTLGHFMKKFQRPLSDIGHQLWTLESLDRFCRHRELASGLKRLNLLARDLGNEGVGLLSNCPHFARLDHLNLSSNSLGPRGIEFLAGSSIAPKLKWLGLWENPLGDDGWKILGRSPLKSLRTLLLWKTDPTALGAGYLARSQDLGNLRYLTLSSNECIGDLGISRILRSAFSARLRYLNLACTGKTAATAAELAVRPLRFLCGLDLSMDRGGDEVCRQLARSSVFPSLRSLNLSGLSLGDPGVELLAQAHGFPVLRRLRLELNDITGEGVRVLAGSPFASSIRSISFRDNSRIDDEGAIAIAESRFMKHLVGVNLRGTGVIQSAIEYLNQSPTMIFDPRWGRSAP